MFIFYFFGLSVFCKVTVQNRKKDVRGGCDNFLTEPNPRKISTKKITALAWQLLFRGIMRNCEENAAIYR